MDIIPFGGPRPEEKHGRMRASWFRYGNAIPMPPLSGESYGKVLARAPKELGLKISLEKGAVLLNAR